MTLPFLSVIASLAAAAWLGAAMLALAPRKPGYSHVRHTISELGEVGAPQQRLVAFGVFLPVGLLLALAGALLRDPFPAGAALALCIAIGYLVAAVFPCDPGSPVSGSPRQGAHNLGGAVEYVGGGLAFMKIGHLAGIPFAWAGWLVLGAAVALTLLPAGAPRGLMQRVAETVLFGGLAWAAWLAQMT